MKYDVIMIRFGELYTKGKNKINFISQLFENVKTKISMFEGKFKLVRHFDRIFIEIIDHEISDELISIVSRDIFGIHSISLAIRTPKDLEAVKTVALQMVQEYQPKTFKLEAHRSDKTFEYGSTEIKQLVAPHVLRNSDVKVDVHNPELQISIEVRTDGILVFNKRVPAAGGLPVGVSGKGLVMLSGGIDSPVASYLTLKRGMSIEFLHFTTPPHTSEEALNKVKTLVGKIGRYANAKRLKLHVINFTMLQHELMHISNETYRITLMRRMFYRIGELLCERRNLKTLITGESLGQVASQTIESINTINDVVNISVLRPLICFDKIDIIKIAEEIGTYQTSIIPFEDCCSLFVPQNPVTRPNIPTARALEEEIMWKEILDMLIQKHWTIYEIESESHPF